ncbi:Ras-related protein Rab [Acrasis kona]|uniref:Ras-related protein Rab n=1 Tax=Acrasis kona TaxID=1008807 RepID=A0AAW2ZAJ5_9EUKA
MSSASFFTLSSGLKDRLQKVCDEYTFMDKDITEKMSVTFVGLKSTWKTGILHTLTTGKEPANVSEVPIRAAQSYNLQLSEDHKVEFEVRDMDDDKSGEAVRMRKDAYSRSTGYVLCFNSHLEETFAELEKYFVMEIKKSKIEKKNNSKSDIAPFVLLSIDYQPNGAKVIRGDQVADTRIVHLANTLGKEVALVTIPSGTSSKDMCDVLDKILRMIYHAGGGFATPALDKEFINSCKVYEPRNQKPKEKSCILQ